MINFHFIEAWLNSSIKNNNFTLQKIILIGDFIIMSVLIIITFIIIVIIIIVLKTIATTMIIVTMNYNTLITLQITN